MSAPEKYRRALLVALREAGSWTQTDVAVYGRANGGTRSAYQALDDLIEKGRVVREAGIWRAVR